VKYFSVNFNNFIQEAGKVHPQLDYKNLNKALIFAIEAHKRQKRESGEEYINHPVNVAYILVTMKMDTATVIAGLLHDVLEDTNYKHEDLVKHFGSEIADLVNGVTKIESFPYHTKEKRKELQAENFRKLLISITKDVRIILIKLADRVHNMRTLEYLPQYKQIRIARETLDIYAPLANRFGIAKIQWELEDLCFKYLYPNEYKKIIDKSSPGKKERHFFINDIIESIRNLLSQSKIEAEVMGRSKNLYSIYLKNIIKKIKFEEILDLIGIRIIVKSVEDCYKVLGVIQTKYTPIKKGFRDYISQPKPNGYQSLHIVVESEENKIIEIQIRTFEMHLVAEEGIAAHWKYKEFYNPPSKRRKKVTEVPQIQETFERQLTWIRTFLRAQDNQDPKTFLQSLKLNLYPDIIVVRTPENDYFQLQKHSTPIDLAFKVHTEVGFHCEGAFINGKLTPIRTELHTGDVVQIKTSPQAKPSKDWINIIRSAKSRQKVRSYFSQMELQEFLELGKEIFYKKSRKIHLKIKSEEKILEIARLLKVNDVKTFFIKLGKEEILFDEVKTVLEKSQLEDKDIVKPGEQIEFDDNILLSKRREAKGIVIENIDSILIRYAKCCNPVPGDEIVGYTTRGRGLTVHREDCTNPGFVNLRKREPERITKVKWDYKKKEKDED
jgi:GTP pyrophosphokinase